MPASPQTCILYENVVYGHQVHKSKAQAILPMTISHGSYTHWEWKFTLPLLAHNQRWSVFPPQEPSLPDNNYPPCFLLAHTQTTDIDSQMRVFIMRCFQGPSFLRCREGTRLGIREKRSNSASATSHSCETQPFALHVPVSSSAYMHWKPHLQVITRIILIQHNIVAKFLCSGVRLPFKFWLSLAPQHWVNYLISLC